MAFKCFSPNTCRISNGWKDNLLFQIFTLIWTIWTIYYWELLILLQNSTLHWPFVNFLLLFVVPLNQALNFDTQEGDKNLHLPLKSLNRTISSINRGCTDSVHIMEIQKMVECDHWLLYIIITLWIFINILDVRWIWKARKVNTDNLIHLYLYHNC